MENQSNSHDFPTNVRMYHSGNTTIVLSTINKKDHLHHYGYDSNVKFVTELFNHHDILHFLIDETKKKRNIVFIEEVSKGDYTMLEDLESIIQEEFDIQNSTYN